jgi:SAM-dependent methyltransferase
MGFFSKMRLPGERHASSLPVSRGGVVAGAAGLRGASSAPARATHPSGDHRVSNGLKEFLWNLEGLGHGSLLDLGPVWQSTITFFVERGFKVYADDLLRDWKEFVTAEDERLRKIRPGEDASEMTAESRADRFLESNIKYARDTFDGILLWDLLDYMDRALVKRFVEHLADVLRPGGVIFAMFHTGKPELFYRYRILDRQTLELTTAPPLFSIQRSYQNREIQDLFRGFRTSKAFVGRDQLREALFIK